MPRTPNAELVYRDQPDTAAHGAVIGLVPADRVSVVAVDLPELRGTRLAQALRWAAEDALAGDAENQHVVPLDRREDGRMLCAVASRTDMQRWRADDPALQALVPDAAALPWEQGDLVLAEADEAVLARWGRFDFDRLDATLLDVLLPELIAQARPTRVRWFGGPPPEAVASLAPEQGDLREGLQGLLAPGARAADVNLLYGDFASAAQRAAPAWGWTVALLVIAAVLMIADAAIDAAQLDRRAAALDEEIRERAERLFPDLQLLPGRERLQIERALAERREGGDRMVRVLRRSGPVFGGLQGVTVESLQWGEAGLDLALRAPGLPDLEALQRQLEGRGLDVRLEDIAIDTGTVRGRLVLDEGGA